MEQVSLIVENSMIVTMDGARRIIESGSIAIREDRIVYVGEKASLAGAYHADRIIDGQGKAVLPGLVDLHFHSYLTRGIDDDKPLDRWLLDVIYPKVRALTPEEAYLGALVSYCEAVKSGTTCVNDMWKHMSSAAKAAELVGVRANLSGLVADDSEGLETLEANERLFREKHGTAGGRVHVLFGIEWLPLISLETVARVRQLANHYGARIHIHLNESLSELAMVQKRHGKRPVEFAYDMGILSPDCVAAHCVWLTKREIALLKETGTHVSHNPVSNAKIGCGIAPVPELIAEGVNVGLGHDGAASNNSRDMFEVMKWAALVHRADRADASVMPAGRVLEMATLNGARALGLHEEIGSIEVGKKADLVLIDLSSLHLTPIIRGRHGNLLSHLVYSTHGDDVDTVIIDGRMVMEGRRILTVDEERVKNEVNEASRKLVDRVFGH